MSHLSNQCAVSLRASGRPHACAPMCDHMTREGRLRGMVRCRTAEH
eukprot:CAMPEP_0175449196 /NCGR_PEP_ID=MMETSP0095-20121207/61719_1 /TAXON_ID=311494 /ORGANISM="Alexandrium monilatum, Strain CCMP3105" /LENGTH=45 /DNA_ID= /DNA_START= /DNA_END= /DNA_ORIENTATION=